MKIAAMNFVSHLQQKILSKKKTVCRSMYLFGILITASVKKKIKFIDNRSFKSGGGDFIETCAVKLQ
jgi:hypothetical protein